MESKIYTEDNPTITNNTLTKQQAALIYAQQGIPVIPLHNITESGHCSCNQGIHCKHPGKHPRTKHGYKDATLDLIEIKKIWTKVPDANIGIPTGSKSSIVVIDIDPKNGGEKSLQHLALTLPADIFNTYITNSGGGGIHFYFSLDDEVKKFTSQLNGIDYMDEGSYIIAPPSNHYSGKLYCSQTNIFNIKSKMIKLPKELSSALSQPKSKKDSLLKSVHDNQKDNYFPTGSRNKNILSIAGKIKSIKIDFNSAKEIILKVNKEKCIPPLSDTEVENIVKSVYNYNSTHYLLSEHHTDLGNAQRISNFAKDKLFYCGTMKKWFWYSGKSWEADLNDYVYIVAGELAQLMRTQAELIEDDKIKKQHLKLAKELESKKRIEPMLTLSHFNLHKKIEELDTNLDLFNVQNGTFNLTNMVLMNHSPSDLITQISKINIDKTKECPKFIKFINDIMDNNHQMVKFIQRVIGYTLSGYTKEQILLILYGCGANGKSTLIEALKNMMGDYALQTDVTTFLNDRGNGVRNDIARLKDARMVIVSETPEGKKLDERLLKEVTGGENVTARYLYQENFEFKPKFKLWILTNHKPNFSNTDHGIWRRIILIPFNRTFSTAEQNKNLSEELKDELPGIFNWACDGYIEWSNNGLQIPQEVLDATNQYHYEQDIIQQFIESECALIPNSSVRSNEIYESFVKWSDLNGINEKWSNMKFSKQLENKGFEKFSTNYRFFKGITLKDSIPTINCTS